MATGFEDSTITAAQYQEPETFSFEAFQSEAPKATPTWADTYDSIQRISALVADWDGMGATTPSSATIANSKAALSRLKDAGASPPTIVRASPDGSICVEWREPAGAFEVEISDQSLDMIETIAGRTKVTTIPLTR